MKQHGTLDNACGIIAALHAIFNNPEAIEILDGSVLSTFRDRCLGQSPESNATTLENYQEFKEQHSAFASQG